MCSLTNIKIDCDSKSRVVLSYVWLVIIYIAAHILLCLVSGQWWDDWCYWLNGPEQLKVAYFESGMPLQAYFILSVMWLPNWGYRVVVFFLYLVTGLLFYSIVRNINLFSNEDAFYIAAVAMTVPVNDARIVLNCYGYSLEITLFMIGFYIATLIEKKNGLKHIILRVFSLLLLSLSYVMESLLVFTGLIWMYFFYLIWKRNRELKLIPKVIMMIKSHWDFLILPFAFYIIKRSFFKPYGMYSGYNTFTIDSLIIGTLVSPCSAFITFINIIMSYIKQLGLVSVIALCIVVVLYVILFQKKETKYDKDTHDFRKNLIVLLLGGLVFYAGVYSYIIIRNGMPLANTGVAGRDSILAGFGIGFVVVAFLKLIPINCKLQNVILIAIIVLGVFHFNDWYLNYQEDWYHQQELAIALEQSDEIKQANTILCDFSTYSPIDGTRFYSINGMSYLVTGKMDKFYYSGIEELHYGLTEQDFSECGFNCDDYDSSNNTIDCILYLNNSPIKNTELIKLRFYELFDHKEYERMLGLITDYQYVKISEDNSNQIYYSYVNGILTQETLHQIIGID